MLDDNRKVRAKDIMGKIVISEESGRKFGVVGDVSFIPESGELMSILIASPTKHAVDLEVHEDDKGNIQVPFSSVRSVGDFVIVSEKEII
ncbi:MAG: PRC-barrel domain-containing protein [Candidatus Aenigmarchaeota archaeon]|nr:PRC-barrel domain-containing protein [Candidatus Aenigmarchaeota archaeon]